MTVCARAVAMPDGTLVLALDPAVQDFSTCPYVVETNASNAWRELGALSIEDAQVIGVSVGLVWAIAWGFKAVRRSINLTPERDS